MKQKELFTYYSLSECSEQEKVLSKLDKLLNEDKIEYIYEINSERLKLIDIELLDNDINNLLKLFYNEDVIPDLDYEEPDELSDNMGYFEDYE